MFSPLPPSRSEIGNNVVPVARALAGMADLTLWTDQAEISPEVAEIAPVQRYRAGAVDYARLNQADAVVYAIGNNANFHRTIFDVARTTPGVMVLHDTRLQHFFARYSETEGADRAFYFSSIRRSHGPQAEQEARAWFAGELDFDTLATRYPMTAAVADYGLCTVVHNEAEQRVLAGQTWWPVHYLPLAFGAGPVLDRSPGNGTLRLVVFGFIGANRRLPSILEALAGLWEEAIELDIYGQIDEPAQVDELVARYGLHDRVRRHGFVDDLSGPLRRADLAINLRYPSMGEASGSQLRIWDAGLPALVTRTGWYAGLPDDAVFFVEPDDEVATLRKHLRAACRDLAPFRRAGRRGRAVLEQLHTPAEYARGLLRVAQEAMGQHRRRAAFDLSRSAAQRLLACTDEPGIALCAQSVAARIGQLSRA